MKAFGKTIVVAVIIIFSPLNVFADTQTIFEPTSCTFNNLDLQNVISNEVDLRISGLTAGTTTKNIFSTRGSDVSPWVRNTNVWTEMGTTSIDLTGISPWNTSGTYQRAGVLITPQHILMAKHWPVANGGTVVFVDNSNNIITRTVSSSTDILDPNTGGNTDIRVGILDSAVPSEITHYPILSDDQYTEYLENAYGDRLPLLSFNYDGEALVRDTSSISYNNTYQAYFYNFQSPSNATRLSFYESAVSGDSSQPSFLIIGDKPVVVMTNTFTSSGASFPTYLDQIETAIDALSDSIVASKYDVSTFDLDCFVKYPKFLTGSLDVDENSSNSSLVGLIPFSSEDGYDIDWEILSGNIWDTFSVSTSGSMYVDDNTNLDYGSKDTFSITLSATYTGTDYDYMSKTGIVTVNVNDVEEIPELDDETFSLNENSANGTEVGNVTTIHDDEGQTLTYTIVSGNDLGVFSINSDGDVLVESSGQLNYESDTKQYSLIVSATDDGPNNYSATSSVIINISDVNEIPVVGVQDSSVDEDASVGTLAGIVTATDPDSGQTLSYQINSGNTGSVFSIDSDGEIRVARSGVMSREVKDRYTLVIQVSDDGASPLSVTTNVNIEVIEGSSQSSGGGGGGPRSTSKEIEDLEKQIVELTNILNQLKGTNISFASYTFTRDLELGSIGEDVRYLQKLLNSKGFTIASTGPGSPGNETSIFGSLTREALIKFQRANNIVPALGYFGPITRGYLK